MGGHGVKRGGDSDEDDYQGVTAIDENVADTRAADDDTGQTGQCIRGGVYCRIVYSLSCPAI